MKKALATLLLLVLASASLLAQIPNGYYNTANGKTGDELRQALHDIIDNHITISYANIWTAFWSTDNKGNGVVWDMYSDGANYSYYYTNSNDQCGDYVQEGDCYNREHSWPKSWFSGGEDGVPGRDLHHIFPTDGYVNQQRGNNPYGEVSTASWTSQNGSKLGTCKSSLGYSGTVFEPIDEYKGDFARVFFYMSTRYYGEDSDWGGSGMTEKANLKAWAVTMLLRWSDNDPVSQKEIDRNNAVYGIQGNRNPFIDNSEYAHMIWDSNWQGGSNISSGDFVKVTCSEDITDGDYLIVCESNNVAFNGSLTTLDAVGNTIDVTITDGVIATSGETNAAYFTIAAKTDGYSIKSASGYYIGNTSDANALKSSQTDDYVNSISITDGNADIVCSLSHLRYNNSDSQTRFRYFKSSTYTGQQDIQLYKKASAYSITLALVEHGSISASAEEAVEGTTIILTATPDPCYALVEWVVTDAQGNAVTVTENQFEMPASDVFVSASFRYLGELQTYYQLVTATDQLVSGQTCLIVNSMAKKALGTTQNTNNRAAVSVNIVDDRISSIGETVCELTLGGSEGAWTFFDANWGDNGGYLYAASSSANQLKTQAANDANGQWSISFGSGGAATITARGSNTRNIIRYNSNNGMPIFSCYASGQQDVYLFVRKEKYVLEQSINLAAGWNWWAPTIDIEWDNLETALDENLLQIVSQSTPHPSQLVPGQMYKIETAAPVNILVSGAYTASSGITIAPGYNWFGFFGTTSTIDSLFDTAFGPVEGDKIISQDEGFAIYGSNGWSGTLTNLKPGHGYVFISNAQGNRTLNLQ